MGKPHTQTDSACNLMVHAFDAYRKLTNGRRTILNRTIVCVLCLFALNVALTGTASAENTIFGDISTRVVTNTSATILWECLETPVKSQIEYGLTTSYGNNTTEKDFSYWYCIDIDGLSEDTTYHYRIRTTDLDSNSVISADYNFTTINSTAMENIVKAARGDGALPKIYYVSPSGNNSNNGLSLGTAWKTPYYAGHQADAGDTIYVVNGTYTGGVDFGYAGGNDGTVEYPITMKAYNGTPVVYGTAIFHSRYITFDGFVVRNATDTHGIDIRNTYGINILNCEMFYSGVDTVYLWNSTHTQFINLTAHNSGWNGFGFKLSSGNSHLLVRDCTIYDCLSHNGYDCHSDFMTIEDCSSDNTSNAAIRTDGNHVMFRNITGTNCSSAVTIMANTSNMTIMNCTFDAPIVQAIGNFNDGIIHNNHFTSVSFTISLEPRGGEILIRENEIRCQGTPYYTYLVSEPGYVTIRDEVFARNSWSQYYANVTHEYTDGKVFRTETGMDPPLYYPDRSNFTYSALNRQCEIDAYNITLRPSYAYLHSVSVDTWGEASDTYRITASSTEPDNPTWINLTTKAASATYNITRDGKSCTPATTGADGVLRYRYTGEWDGPRTFEFSYASDGADPVPCVTNLRNDTPTQNTVTLRWDCSAPDIDHYTIYQNGALLDTTESQYYSATNLSPDTPYTFSVSATTTAGITGENATLSVQTAAEEAEDFGSNTVHIADDVTASRGNSVTVPIMIHNATGVACTGVKLTYDASVVAVTGATQGDFTTFFGFDDEHAADGWVTINTYISGTQLTGDVKVADVTLVAVGEVGGTSPLDMEILSMTDQSGYSVSGTVSNGSFAVVVDNSPPSVTDPSASQLIPDDTDGVPSWGETAVLNVTVTDESDIASVTIDLSAIGGSPVQPMTHIGGNVWSVTTSASAGTPPQTYELQVCATDIHGYTNMSESVELVVMRNGDVTGDGDVRSDDVTLLESYVTYSGQHTVSSEFVADVTGDGVVNIADAMLLANHVIYPDRYTLR